MEKGIVRSIGNTYFTTIIILTRTIHPNNYSHPMVPIILTTIIKIIVASLNEDMLCFLSTITPLIKN